ncbi:MAG: sugar phosphate isomerase/epimerase [Defluviitaleaceae bacterium]|nr:sugar phosphate isomerase/epimerase [Defluviitaleaceae bacterium]
MYFSMDEIGFENTEKIKNITSEADRWQFIYDVAKSYGFGGIHITPSLYKNKFRLDINNIPDYFQDFKLTLHFGGLHNSTTDRDTFDVALAQCFEIATKNNMHDISLHPCKSVYGLSEDDKKSIYELIHKTIDKWLSIALKSTFSLSLETHVSGKYFLFDGLSDFVKFIDHHPDLGVLIDVSHNYYDGYSEDEIIKFLANKNVKGLHISDALQKSKGASFETGTHVAVGDGSVDFDKVLKGFAHIPNLYSALEIKASNNSVARSLQLLHEVHQRIV